MLKIHPYLVVETFYRTHNYNLKNFYVLDKFVNDIFQKEFEFNQT